MTNVLITSASRKVSLVRSFRSALRRHGGGSVIAADISPNAPALYLADRHFLVSRSSTPQFIPELLRLCQQEHVSLLIPTRDEELPLFAEAREQFEQVGIRVLVASPETVRLCQDKTAFLSFCEKHGHAIPCTYPGETWREAKFPLFIKPRFGKGGKGAVRVADETELHTLLKSAGEWIIQECISAPEYTVDLLADFQGRVISAVPRAREFVLAGESYVSRTVNEPRLIEQSARLAADLGLVGHNTIQCFWDGKEAKFIEVNPRFGGAAALGIAAGADTPLMLLKLLGGESLPPCLGNFEPDLVMLRFTDDLFLKGSTLACAPREAAVLPQPSKPAINRVANVAPLEAVLFDLDNTLYPEESFVRSGFQAAANCLAKHLGSAGEPIARRMFEILQIQGRGRVFDTLAQEMSLNSEVWTKTLLLAYRSHRPNIALFPEVADLLQTLKRRGVRLGLVTDGAASVQRQKIAALGLERFMDAIVCTDELGAGCAKPSPVSFQVALALLGVAPDRAAYVGDDPGKDFAGPNRLGMRSVCIRSSGLLGVPRSIAPEALFQPQAEAASLGEVLQLLVPNTEKP